MGDGTPGYVHTTKRYGTIAALPTNCVDEVMFGHYVEGGTVREAAMRWYNLGDSVEPRLEAFADGWALLIRSELLAALAKDFSSIMVSPELFCLILTMCGFEDFTDRGAK